MSEAVVLEYKRVKGDLSTGRVYLKTDVGDSDESLFEDLEFPKMLRLFAERLKTHVDATAAIWQRVDRPGLVPYKLDDTVVRLFREDPVAAIETMCPPAPGGSPSVAVQQVKKTRENVRMISASVRAGYDTLADAFGDSVYAKTRARTNGVMYVECPCCGIWTPMHMSSIYMGEGSSHCMNTRCKVFDKGIGLVAPNDKWAAYSTAALLATASTRFYLPRAWNDGRSWVSWADLNEKYTEYEKEKETWSRTAPHRV